MPVQLIIPTLAVVFGAVALVRSPRFRVMVQETFLHPREDSEIISGPDGVRVRRGARPPRDGTVTGAAKPARPVSTAGVR